MITCHYVVSRNHDRSQTIFAYDTEQSLLSAVDLVNSLRVQPDRLATISALAEHLTRFRYSHIPELTERDLADVRALRTVFDQLWRAADADDIADQVNVLLTSSHPAPRLARHDEWDWHLHLTDDNAPIVHRIEAETAMAFVDLVRSANTDRLKSCAAEDCECVFVDFSRNRSRRFCSERNCANRTHVAAYRERRSQA